MPKVRWIILQVGLQLFSQVLGQWQLGRCIRNAAQLDVVAPRSISNHSPPPLTSGPISHVNCLATMVASSAFEIVKSTYEFDGLDLIGPAFPTMVRGSVESDRSV